MQLNALKCHGSNNQFILIEAEQLSKSIATEKLSQLSILINDKKAGFSTDGLLLFSTIDAKKQLFSMRMFNPDGSEAELCGNGLRCAGRFAMEKANLKKVNIQTPKSLLSVFQTKEIFPDIASFSSEIGPVTINIPTMVYSSKTPDSKFIHRSLYKLNTILDSRIRYTALSAPNPHLIGLSYQPYKHAQVKHAWGALNHAKYFPEGINLSIVSQVKKQENAILAVTCEHGVGPTNACGTGMAASALVAAMMGFADGSKTIKVFNPGGLVYCDLPQNNNETSSLGFIKLTGNATWMKQVSITVDLSTKTIKKAKPKNFIGENNRYKKLAEFSQQVMGSTQD